MRYSKTVAGVAICAASVMGVSAGSAFAGEIQGNGERNVPEHNHPGASDCAYSGLEDHPADREPGDPRETQTPHYVEGFYPPPGTAGFACSPGRP
jgi:hypothetical protein